MNIGGIKIRCALIGVECVSCLVVARLVQSSQVVPNLRDVGVQADSTRVRVKRITVLVDLVIQHANTAPESRVTAITVDSLLVRFVSLGILLLGHVASAQEVPALRISLI